MISCSSTITHSDREITCGKVKISCINQSAGTAAATCISSIWFCSSTATTNN